MIKPTIGRVVWYSLKDGLVNDPSYQPQAALITYVHSDTRVNLVVFNANGEPYSATSVWLMQDDMPSDEPAWYAEWMPYQKGQAAKTEKLEAEIASIPMQRNTD